MKSHSEVSNERIPNLAIGEEAMPIHANILLTRRRVSIRVNAK